MAPNILAGQVRALARNRIGYALFSGAKAVVSSFARTLYVLWLQTTGLMFGVFTVVGCIALFRLYRSHSWQTDHQRLWLSALFTVVCFGFTVSSFLKAERRSR